jgi:diacylglycerol kinase family enzyme
MGIARNEDWGRRGALPASGLVVHDDAAAGALLHDARRSGSVAPTVGLLGGDLCATLGGRGDAERLRSSEATRVLVDAIEVRLDDGAPRHAVAHVIARRSWWRGRTVAVMNAAWLGRWNVAPRAHPGDGLLDLLDGDLPLGDRWKARTRLPLGTHVPHPRISVGRTRRSELAFDPPLDVWLDGVRAGRARRLEVVVLPEALTVVV